MNTLGRYIQVTPLSNKNAGSCRWCFATRDGKEYFIKEFTAPKYPDDESMFPPAQLEKRKAQCRAFEKDKTRVYKSINAYSHGGNVRVDELFRVGARYYMAMERIHGIDLSIADVTEFAMSMKRRLCALISYCVGDLHAGGFVHADLKHSNMMFTASQGHMLTVKVIDYDAGFMEDKPPTDPESLQGDIVYYAPESCCFMMGQDTRLTSKVDIFALGVLFHQYLTGRLPGFDQEKYMCAGDAVASRAKLEVDSDIPEDLKELLERMLRADPKERPDAFEVFRTFRGLHKQTVQSDGFQKDEPGKPGWDTPV